MRRTLSILAALALAATTLVGVATPAQAAYCRHIYSYDSVNTTDGVITVTADLYACDYGNYERPGALRFTWPGGTSLIRKLYLDNFDPRAGVTFYHGNGSQAVRYVYTWYNGESRTLSAPQCFEPCRILVKQMADTVLHADQLVFMDRTF